MTKNTIAKAISALSLAIGAEFTMDEMRLWYDVLRQEKIPESAFQMAVRKYIAFGKSYGKPKLADVLASGKITPPEISDVARNEATHIVNHVRTKGAEQPYMSEHPITQKLLAGRFELSYLGRTLTEENEKWFVREFIEAFESIFSVENSIPQTHFLPDNSSLEKIEFNFS